MGFRDCGALETSPLEPPGGSQVYSLPLQRARKYGHTLKGRLNVLQVPGNNFMPLILMGWRQLDQCSGNTNGRLLCLITQITHSVITVFSFCDIISMM